MPWTGSGYGNPVMNQALAPEVLALQRIGISLQGLVRPPYLELGYMATQNNVLWRTARR